MDKNGEIIAAVRNDAQCKAALDSPLRSIFLLHGSLLTICSVVKEAVRRDKAIFVHIDLAEGIGKDAVGLEFLKNAGVKGIISTKNSLIRQAGQLGLTTVQRLFVVDSQFLFSGMASLSGVKPDFIEIMPGVVPKAIQAAAQAAIAPVIAGGLIETAQEVRQALAAGAAAVSTGKTSLWRMGGEKE